MKIPITRPWFDDTEEKAVLEVLRSGWIAQGEKVRRLEELFAAYVERKYAVAVSSGTAALHLAVLTCKLGPGDEVLVPAFTWISTINAVEYSGATPVFCDIDPFSFNIDVEETKKRITSRTRAILPVHQFGLGADLNSVMRLAAEKSLLVIEDAACALGTYVERKHVGTYGQIGCFSFHPRKSITTGEGGVLVTNEAKDYESFLQLRNIGAATTPGDRTGMADFGALGFNYRMTDLQAAVGIAQFDKLSAILEKRRQCAKRYDDLIQGSSLQEWLQIPVQPKAREHSYQSYVTKIKTSDRSAEHLNAMREKRNDLIARLAVEGIQARPGTHAPPFLSYYRNKYQTHLQDYPHALEAEWLTIALPLYPQMTEGDQELVCSRLQSLWTGT